MSDLLNEIKEDVMREKYAFLWNKYGNYIIGLAVALLLLTGGLVTFSNHINSKNLGYSDELYQAENSSPDKALTLYDDLLKN